MIYKLQCNIHTQYYKDRNSVISTSTKTSSSILSSSSSIHSSVTIQNEINLLKDQNASLQERIKNIKLSQRTSHSNRISFLKSYHKGHRLRNQLNKANAIYRHFINLYNSRFNLIYTNIANLMNLDLQLQCAELINKEKTKLSSTNKIHNFTTTSLPPETISLLNKGTQFHSYYLHFKYLLAIPHYTLRSQRHSLFHHPQEELSSSNQAIHISKKFTPL